MGKFDENENLIGLIKATPVDKLQLIADELRQELLEDVSVSGGHLASNLGVVELLRYAARLGALPPRCTIRNAVSAPKTKKMEVSIIANLHYQ